MVWRFWPNITESDHQIILQKNRRSKALSIQKKIASGQTDRQTDRHGNSINYIGIRTDYQRKRANVFFHRGPPNIFFIFYDMYSRPKTRMDVAERMESHFNHLCCLTGIIISYFTCFEKSKTRANNAATFSHGPSRQVFGNFGEQTTLGL